MTKLSILYVFLLLVVTDGSLTNGHVLQRWDETRAVANIPFCALILREFVTDHESGRELYVLTEPERVTEPDLKLLFGSLSAKYEKSTTLRIWVYTDLSDLASIATNSGHSAYPDNASRGQERYRWAYYKRTDQVELFRHNPAFPEPGMKTIILRGKE